MREFNLPLFMKVKPGAVKELKENLSLYFPEITFFHSGFFASLRMTNKATRKGGFCVGGIRDRQSILLARAL